MAATAISQATREWLAELLEDGWTAEVVESRPVVHTYRLRLVDDLEEAVRERVTPGWVGVRATRGDAVLAFVCADVAEARGLLDGAVAQVAA